MSAPHIERMKDELAQLAERVTKLCGFIFDNPIFRQLSPDERDLMCAQLDYMKGYQATLETRIDLAERSQ